MITDPKNQLTVSVVRYPQAIGANANVTNIDLRDYIGSVDVVFNIGVGTGTSPTYDAYLQSGSESNGANATNISGASITQAANANSFQQISVDTKAVGRYLKVVQTVGGSGTPLMPAGIVLIGTKQVQP
jgi:FlaG/FlaF family flagellin (archaellin)